ALYVGRHPGGWAGPVSNWIKRIDLVLGMDAEVIVPGHGAIPSRQQVLELKEYWEYLLRECRARFQSGQSAWDAARELASGPYAEWAEGERLIVNTEMIYRELGAEAPAPTPIERFRWMAEFEEALGAGRLGPTSSGEPDR